MALADVVELGDRQPEVLSSRARPGPPAAGTPRPASACVRRRRTELEQHHRQLAAGVAGPCVVEVDHAGTPGGPAQVVGPQVEVQVCTGPIGVSIASTATRSGSTAASRSAYGAPAARDALSTPFHSALADRRLEPLRAPESRLAMVYAVDPGQQLAQRVRVEPGVGVGHVDPRVRADPLAVDLRRVAARHCP